MKYLFNIVSKIVLSPLYFFLILIPRMIEYVFYYINRSKITLNMKNHLFLVNPKSGKRFGRTLLKVLPQHFSQKKIIDITTTKPSTVNQLVIAQLEQIRSENEKN